MANKREQVNKPCCCPYCDGEVAEAVFPYCEACKAEVFYCPKCKEAIRRDKQVCPRCGAVVRDEPAEGGK